LLDKIKITVKDSFLYSLGNISTKIIGLILLPLYTDKLSVYEYGILGTVEITIQLMIAAFSFSLNRALSRWYWDQKYKYKQNSIFFTSLLAIIAATLLMLIIFLPFSNRLSQLLLNSDQYSYLFKLMLISAAFQIISKQILILIRLKRNVIQYTVSNILKLIITLGLTIYLIVVLKKGVEGIIEAQIIGFIFLLLINIKFIFKNIEPVFESYILKKMLKYSYPLAFSTISGVILIITDKYAIRYIVGMEEMGLYILGFKIANILKIFIINSVISAIGPLRFMMMNKTNNKRFYSKLMTYTSFGFIFLLLVLSLFSKEAIKVLAENPQYWKAYQFVPILCFAQLFELLRQNSNFGLLVEKKTKIISLITFSVSALNILLNISLIYLFGVFGAPIALLVTQISFFALIFHYSQQYYFIRFELRKVFIMILLSASIVIISYVFINSINIYPRIIIKLVLIISFPVLLFFFNFYEKVELDRLRGAWIKWRDPRRWKDNISKIKIK
jgi:O-antigen/teichoic acid export membrane protein